MKYLINIIKGVALGISTLVPGVSGGTMAIILGVYDNLIHAVGSFFKEWKKHILFLLQMGIGGLIGLVGFSKIMETALIHFEFPMIYLFLGIIFGGLPVLYKKAISVEVKEKKKTDYIFLLIGFAVVFLMTLQPNTIVNLATSTGIASFMFNIVAGLIIAIALILPGISTSFMLLTLGLYQVTLDAINTRNLAFLIPIGIGGIIGTFGTAKIIENLLNKHPKKTYFLIIGFVLGSIIEVFPGIPTGMNILYCLLSFVVGLGLILLMSKWNKE